MNSLSRKKDYRENLIRNLATSLVLYEKIQTTDAKAKVVKAKVEHLISQSKKADLISRRRLLGYFFDKNAVKKMFEVIVPRFKKQNSGFIKSYRLGRRLGDGASITLLLIDQGEVEPVIEQKPSKDEKKTKKIADKENGSKKPVTKTK